MAQDIKTPTLLDLLRNDVYCLFYWQVPGLVLLATIGLVVGSIFLEGDPSHESIVTTRNVFIGVAALVLVPSLVLLFRRVSRIQTFFDRGERLRGQAAEIKEAKRGYSTLVYSFEHAGQPQTGEVFIQSERTTTLKKGDWVTVLVDPATPGESLLAEAFDF